MFGCDDLLELLIASDRDPVPCPHKIVGTVAGILHIVSRGNKDIQLVLARSYSA